MTEREKALACLAELSPERAKPHETWLAVGMALHHCGASLQDWERWHPDNSKNHARTCAQKWASFGRSSGAQYTIATLVKWAKEDNPRFKVPQDLPPGTPENITWSTTLPAVTNETFRSQPSVQIPAAGPEADNHGPDIDLDQLPPETIPEPSPDWPSDDLRRYMLALYKPEEICSYVLDAFNEDGTWKPGSRGIYGRTVADILASVSKHGDKIDQALGAFNPEAGAWCRINPMDGTGVRNDNVTDFRHVLAESDTLPIAKQLAIIKALNLPCSAIVHSGGKSIHAIVRVDAGTDPKLYRERVDFLFQVLDRNGFKVDRQCRNPSRLSRMPGLPRKGQKQYLVSEKAGASDWAAWENFIKADTDPLPNIRSIADFKLPAKDDPNELLKDRYLCRGGALLMVGPTGIGKSSFVMQAAFRWALGDDFFGIQAAQALKVLIIQAENDDGDIAEIREGVYRGLEGLGQMTDGDQLRIARQVWVVPEDSVTGRDFGERLERYLEKIHPDLVIIDPALAYLGGDALKQADVTLFCRNILNPIIHRHNVGLVLVHHTNKPPKADQKDGWQAGDMAYLGQGAADWANWARAVMAITSIGSHSIFKLIAGKRGGRIGWKDEEWHTLYSKHIAHAKDPGQICWREPTVQEVFDETASQDGRKAQGRPAKVWTEERTQAVTLAQKTVRTKSQLENDILKTITGVNGSVYKQHIQSAIKAAVDSGILEEGRAHNGTSIVHLIGPADGSVQKRADKIAAERQAKKQKDLNLEK